MKKTILINAAIAFSIAAITQMTLHEVGHFLAALYFHATNLVLHHNYVSYDENNLQLTQRIIIAAAGPITSILLGILFHFLTIKYKKANVTRLVLLYMSINGYIGFFGYLMIAPIFSYGDTGFICKALNFPIFITIAIAIIGLIALVIVIRKIGKEFVAFISKEAYEDDNLRKKFFNNLVHIPLYIGIAITTLLNIPVPTVASLTAPLFSPFSIMWCYGSLMRKRYSYPTNTIYTNDLESISKVWLVVFMLVILLNRFLAIGALK